MTYSSHSTPIFCKNLSASPGGSAGAHRRTDTGIAGGFVAETALKPPRRQLAGIISPTLPASQATL